ncbi:hypothetical protein ILUMI_17041 [Ignelater luminosus]|uniref:Uncharacterized protein n=1 Tax=Ignelater luminosus TaxID=2038154 RepID=A0A8K0CRS3_IGNLU|nr:hypothetical protein ILUMI_17041 [Ignelater luminosus]
MKTTFGKKKSILPDIVLSLQSVKVDVVPSASPSSIDLYHRHNENRQYHRPQEFPMLLLTSELSMTSTSSAEAVGNNRLLALVGLKYQKVTSKLTTEKERLREMRRKNSLIEERNKNIIKEG